MKQGQKYSISKTLLKADEAQPGPKPFELDDSRLPGFKLRVQPSGVRSYVIQWARGKRKTLAKVGEVTPAQAREMAEIVVGNVRTGKRPMHGLDSSSVPTLGEFIGDRYRHLIEASHRRPSQTIDRLKLQFGSFYSRSITDDITPDLEAWKAKQLQAGASASSVCRDLATLSGVYRRASRVLRKDVGELKNPVRDVERPKVDTDTEPRSLSRDDEQALRAALLARDEAAVEARARINVKRERAGRDLKPALPYFADHLTPMILLSINTGCRRGELFALTWAAVDLDNKTLTVIGERSKNNKTRLIPLNAEAIDTLARWREQLGQSDGLVFPGKEGGELTTIKTAWLKVIRDAGIDITWHGLRHTFGTRLADAGVGLHTIQALMGHSDIRVTARYTKARDPAKRAAVDLLANQHE